MTDEDGQSDRVDLLHSQAPDQATRGAGSPTAALTMVFTLTESAQERWRAITGAHLVPLVRAGASFENEAPVEREEAAAA
ncbi:hypothetical protein ACFWIH_43110 [Streptomyces chartreusis]|uniref:hypothetical protein n=1 Tax=Streptomyces chartreusis TaxID=1969 RepID=UPI0036699B97